MKYSKFNLILENKNENNILFNTLYGNCFIINNNIKKIIESGDINQISKYPIYKDFIEKSIIIADYIDENRFIEYFRNKIKFDTTKISSTILLSWNCNLACIYCYEGAGYNLKSNNLSSETAKKYIKFMKNIAIKNRSKEMYINLFGGEPLVNIDIGIYILENLKKFCDKNSIIFSASIITNGTLLSNEIINKLYINNCRYFQITLDGTENVHNSRRLYKNGNGSYKTIIKNIQKLNSYDSMINTVIRINIDKTNIVNAYRLLEELGDNGLKLTNCNVDFGIVRGSTSACSSYSSKCFIESEIGEILKRLWEKAEAEGFKINTSLYQKWIYCGLYSEGQYTISPDGDVYKCWEHAGEPEHKMGSLNSDGEITNLTYAYFDWMSHNPLENFDCKDCLYLPLCGGGCGVISYNKSKTYHDSGCYKVKGVIEKQIEKYVYNMSVGQ